MTQTSLGLALIGLAFAKPQTGYALRKAFEDSPLGVFSSSPGSIYPALAKLEKAGLLDRRPQAVGGKPLYHVTQSGRGVLHDWLSAEITIEEVAREVDLVLLRFAFLQSFPDDALTRRFLRSFSNAVGKHLDALRTFLESAEGQALSAHGRWAMQNGILGYETHLNWAEFVLEELDR
ncbi:PadR family transcriptional regulator [Altererythrobacter sp.]|uniref:PadR family transcriptional regulator n=1 Tax=Altererythrobacter sp. TaxID=1872480 RepID=UPI003D0CD32F